MHHPTLALFLTAIVSQTVLAAHSFAGSNLYYAAGLSKAERTTLLSAMQSAGMKVLRVWLDGESDATTKNTPITAYPSLEPNAIGTYNDTVLNLLDEFMVDSAHYNIKVGGSDGRWSTKLADWILMISMHSFNALQGGDVYGATYGISDFYTSDTAQSQFDARLRHVMDHVHKDLHKPWKELSHYIFAFEAQNEAMIGDGEDFIEAHQQWQCDRANTIKTVLGNDSGILVTTGGESFLDESIQPDWLSCSALDVVAIHAYGVGDFDQTKLQGKISQAQAAGKKLILQEWGSCYYNTENNVCNTGTPLDSATRNSNIQAWSSTFSAVGLPWMYWQVIPNADPHFGSDYEIGAGASLDPSWNTLKNASLAALNAEAAFDFTPFLL